MPDRDTITQTVATYMERWNANDREGWVALFTEDARQEDPVGAPPNVGHEAIGAFFDAMKGMAASTIEARNVVVCGNEAAVPLVVTATMGDQQFRLDGVDHFVFAEDGRISSLRAFLDLPAG